MAHKPNYDTPLKMYLPDEVEIRQDKTEFSNEHTTYVAYLADGEEETYAGLGISLEKNSADLFCCYGKASDGISFHQAEGPYLSFEPHE